MSDDSSNAIIRAISPAYIGELRAAFDRLADHAMHFKRLGLTPQHSTSREDCLLLYLLARHFRRRSALDVGTNVGMTAVAIHEAVSRNGGNCTSCDPVDLKALPAGIRFLHGTVNDAIKKISTESRTIDFAFFDWVPDVDSLLAADGVFAADAILAVHDYCINDDKGEQIVEAINRNYRRANSGTWFFPASPPINIDGVDINVCTAFFLPHILTRLPAA